EYPSGNNFGMTAFVSYGAFWITLVALIALPHTGIIPASNHAMMGAYLSLWGLFSVVMFFGTLRMTPTHQFIFATLVILFFLLAFTEFTGSKVLGHIAGWEGLVCGFSAIYLAAAEILEAQFGRSILPVGKAAPKHTALL
ncbi:MAG: acetate uptake transporter, partial [Acetobacter sp.]|nr:acetate uptake transporter [Acetobacter sp.]